MILPIKMLQVKNMYTCPRKWAWLFPLRIRDFLETTHLTRQKRGLEAFRAFSCVFYISTSNVVQFGSITLTLKELLPPWQIRRPHLCIDVAPLSENRISKRVLFDIGSYFWEFKISNFIYVSYWPKTVEFAAFQTTLARSAISGPPQLR